MLQSCSCMCIVYLTLQTNNFILRKCMLLFTISISIYMWQSCVENADNSSFMRSIFKVLVQNAVDSTLGLINAHSTIHCVLSSVFGAG